MGINITGSSPLILLHLPILWEIDEKPMHFLCEEVYHRMGIGWEKRTHTRFFLNEQFLLENEPQNHPKP